MQRTETHVPGPEKVLRDRKSPSEFRKSFQTPKIKFSIDKSYFTVFFSKVFSKVSSVKTFKGPIFQRPKIVLTAQKTFRGPNII